MEEAVDFSDSREVNKLIKHLKDIKTPPPLIVADALADILLNEDKAHDINQVYRNIWRVVHAHDACFGAGSPPAALQSDGTHVRFSGCCFR